MTEPVRKRRAARELAREMAKAVVERYGDRIDTLGEVEAARAAIAHALEPARVEFEKRVAAHLHAERLFDQAAIAAITARVASRALRREPPAPDAPVVDPLPRVEDVGYRAEPKRRAGDERAKRPFVASTEAPEKRVAPSEPEPEPPSSEESPIERREARSVANVFFAVAIAAAAYGTWQTHATWSAEREVARAHREFVEGTCRIVSVQVRSNRRLEAFYTYRHEVAGHAYEATGFSPRGGMIVSSELHAKSHAPVGSERRCFYDPRAPGDVYLDLGTPGDPTAHRRVLYGTLGIATVCAALGAHFRFRRKPFATL